MSLSFLPQGSELVPVENEVIELTIIPADTTAPGEPAFVVHLNRLIWADFQAVQEAVEKKKPIGGVRPGTAAQERLNEEFRQRYARKVYDFDPDDREKHPGWRGLTARNWNHLAMTKEKLVLPKGVDEVAFSYEAASFIHKKADPAVFDKPIYDAVREAAEEDLADTEGKESA